MTKGQAGDGVAFRPAVARAAAEVIEARRRIGEVHREAGRGAEVCGFASGLFEAIVHDVWVALVADLPAQEAESLGRSAALVAIGGFGRGEMAPFSDIDLMILHDGTTAAVVADAARRLLQDLFDAGLDVGQSVRTPAEAATLAVGDATILSALLDLRRLAGAEEPLVRLQKRLRSIVSRGRRRLVDRVLEARREEVEKHGGSELVLEPNVKRSRGGLRDIQLLRWLGRVAYGAESFDDLVAAGGMARADADAVRDARDFLLTLRTDLHLAAGKSADELTRDQQTRIAAARGFDDGAGLLGVERFMREYFGHARRVAGAVEALLRSIRRAGIMSAMAQGLLGHEMEGTFRVGPVDVAVLTGRLPQVTQSLRDIVRLAGLSMLYDLPVANDSWEEVRAAVPSLPREADPAATKAFLDLFDHPTRVASALRWLHGVGLLEVLVPPFAHARDLMQFNSVHRYTVDEHCLIAVERAAAFAGEDDWLGDEWRALRRKRPLLLALLLHDVGKGYEEDHCVLGARIVREVATLLRLPEEEAAIVEFLVLHHLDMAQLAFRRDIGDDTLVASFAREVGSPELLRMLALLTAADVSAVGPGMWTTWKSDLLGGLFSKAVGILDGEGPTVAADRCRHGLDALLAGRDADDPVLRLAVDLPSSYLAAVTPTRGMEEIGRLARLPRGGVFVTARWQPATSTVAVTVGTHESVAAGIFHRVTGGLTSQRLEILAADIHTLSDGHVIDHFTVVDHDFAGEPPAERLADIAESVKRAILSDATPDFAPRWNPFAPQVKAVPTTPVQVTFDNESSERDTILEVFAHDRPGLLYGVTKALFEKGLSVQAAKIGTYRDQVVDAFHVTTTGGKVIDPDAQQAIREAIVMATTPVTGPASSGPRSRPPESEA